MLTEILREAESSELPERKAYKLTVESCASKKISCQLIGWQSFATSALAGYDTNWVIPLGHRAVPPNTAHL